MSQVQVVGKEHLGQPTFLAEGGFGKVYRVAEYHLPDDTTPLAYKEFSQDHAAQAASARAAVTFRTGLDPDERAELDRYSVWPRALVEDLPGKVCGLLMPLIPPDFFCERIDVDTGLRSSKPREMQWLIARDSTIQAAEVNLPEVSETDRLFLLVQLVYIIGWLHRRGWVFGDLSFKNAAFALRPPQLMLLDCDGAAAVTDWGRKQVSTPFWGPPEFRGKPPGQVPLQDLVTDAYKLGLAVLRSLNPGEGATTLVSARHLLGKLDDEGVELVGRALSADRDRRPTARELFGYLERVTAPRILPPKVAMAELATPFCLRGQDAWVEWQVTGADHITIRVGNDFEITVDPVDHPRSCSFQPDESGPVVIEVDSKYGTVTRPLGGLTLYELPPVTVSIDDLPMPQIPPIETFSAEPLVARLTGHPRFELKMPEIPVIPAPQPLDIVDRLAPDRNVLAARPRIENAATKASKAVTELILGEGDNFLREIRKAVAGGGND